METKKNKKNRQYQRSKKRVLKYKIPGDREIAAMRIAFEVIMMAVQLQKEISQPVPRFPKGGIMPGSIMAAGRTVSNIESIKDIRADVMANIKACQINKNEQR